MADTEKTIVISEQQIDQQYLYMQRVRALLQDARPDGAPAPKCYVDTYGCQQNEADSERLRGMAIHMGYELSDQPAEAELFIINTCAIRDHAEQRVLSNIGALARYYKKGGPAAICVCGCMASQEHMAQKLKKSFPAVRIVFNTHALWRFPEILYTYKMTAKRQFVLDQSAGNIAEGLPAYKDKSIRAWLPISYGCNNFCSYCVVPFVRGRERSRTVSDIVHEAKTLIDAGYRDITLLGQNVNSYCGIDEDGGVQTFPALLLRLCALEGDFTLRFMTSHPKDASRALIDVMAAQPKIAKALHLPVQSGSDKVLRDMNRSYTRQKYLDLIAYAKEKMPGLTLTSDIIVGFPTEQEQDFQDTLSLVEAVQFDSLFTFIYSPRIGTKAADMKNLSDKQTIAARFERLLDTQNNISWQRCQALVGKTIPVLIDELQEGRLTGRSDGGILTVLEKNDAAYLGQRANCYIERTTVKALYGHIVDKNHE